MKNLVKWIGKRILGLALILGSALFQQSKAQCVSPGTPINFNTAGNNKNPDYLTVYVLTDDSGNILARVKSGFPAPNFNGGYRLYTINYRTGAEYTAPTLTNGTNISAIGGTCVAGNVTYNDLCVVNGCVRPGTSIALRTLGNNTTSDFATQYVVTDKSELIVSTSTVASILAPALAGEYHIYTINYNMMAGKEQPMLTAGTAIGAVGGDCVDTSVPLAFCVSISLPVKLASFEVKKNETAVNLNWTTSEETKANRFEVQRSANAVDWQAIGEITAAGESKTTVQYSFSDRNPIRSVNYYRLKMIDFDESFAFSGIRNVSFESNALNPIIFPNPVSEMLFFSDANVSSVKSVTFINRSGQVVLHTVDVSQGIVVSRLQPGLYTLRIDYSDLTQSKRNVVVAR